MARRVEQRRCAGPASAAALMAAAFAASDSAAQEGIIGGSVERQATAALAVLGITAVPNETASTLFLDGGSGGDSFDYQSGQIFGGFTISDDYPIFFDDDIDARGRTRFGLRVVLGGRRLLGSGFFAFSSV